MKKTFIIASLLISTLLTLAIGEVVLRVMEHSRFLCIALDTESRWEVDLYTFDPDLGWRFRPGFMGITKWPSHKTPETINSEGWRDRLYARPKPDGVFRVAVLGCSRTYGYGVNIEEAYSKVLEKRLRTAGNNVEVLNFGVNGYGLTQMALNYSKFVSSYQPDLVLLQYYLPTLYRTHFTSMWNTPKPAYRAKNGRLKLVNHPVRVSPWKSFQDWLIKNSLLYRFVKVKMIMIGEIRNQEFKENILQNAALHELNALILADLNKKVTADGGKLAVMVWGKDRVLLKDICRQAKVKVFALEDYSSPEEWEKKGALENPPPIGHWSPLGHRYVADSLYKFMIKVTSIPDN